MRYPFEPPRAAALLVAAGFLLLLAPLVYASHPCPTPQPPFAYVDVDNDGCHTTGVDSGSVDSQLQAAVTMANVPSFVGPPDTGLVIPNVLSLPTDADPFWSVPNDVWIDGEIVGPSSVRIEAGGTTYIHGSIRVRTKGFSNEGDVRLGCAAGCGSTVIADGVRLANNGLLAIYDAEIGDDVRIGVSCSPGGVPSCGGRTYFARPTVIGHRLRLKSPGGIHFDQGTSPLTVGDDARLTTKSVRTDGGTLGFSILIELDAAITFGSRARLRAGGSVWLDSGDSGPALGPVTLGTDAQLAGSGIFVSGTAVDIGARSELRGKRDLTVEGQLSSIGIGAETGPLLLGDESTAVGGFLYLNSAGLLDVGSAVQLASSGGDQGIELEGAQIVVGPGARVTKTTSDLNPVAISAASSIAISSSFLRGAGLDITVSDPSATIAFTDNEAAGQSGTVATFVAPGGTCDLTGSAFAKLAVDTTGCGTVIGP